MNKITRKHYNRKLIMGGLMAFASIALISTGFAAFVLSTNAEHKVDGNVNVGTVTKASLKIEPVELSSTSILFEPTKDDKSGRVRNDDKNFECLSINISGEIQNSQYLAEKGFTIKLELPQKFQQAITDGYIVAPECAGKEVAISTSNHGTKPNVKTFSYDVVFTWGTKFNGMNPGLYYDTDPKGTTISDEEMTTTLENFRKAAYGLTDSNGEPASGDNVFHITLTAKAS